MPNQPFPEKWWPCSALQFLGSSANPWEYRCRAHLLKWEPFPKPLSPKSPLTITTLDRSLNLISLIQPSETLPVELTRTHILWWHSIRFSTYLKTNWNTKRLYIYIWKSFFSFSFFDLYIWKSWSKEIDITF